MKYVLTFIFTFLFIACSSVKTTKKAIVDGNYDKAIALAIENLRGDKTKKSNQTYVFMLQEAFVKASQRDKERIKHLKSEANSEDLKTIYKLYKDLIKRQEKIKRLLPLPILKTKKTAVFNFKNYSSELISSKNAFSKYIYSKSKANFNSSNKYDFRTIYNDLMYLEKNNPNYKDTRNLLNKAHDIGTDYVFVSMKNESEVLIPMKLEEDLLNFDTYGLDDFWTVYHSKKNSKIDYDFGLELNIRKILISPEQVKEKEIIQEKQIKDGWRYLLDENDDQVRDSLGNKIKVDNLIDVQCKIYKFTQFKTSFIAGQVKYIDYRTNQVKRVFPIKSEFLFEHRYANYDGDKRAIGKSYRYLTRKGVVPFPSNEQMVFDTGNDLKRKLKYIITRNKFRK